MAEVASYKRPPVPSAEESSRAGLLAPLVAYLFCMAVARLAHDPIVMVVACAICAAIILIGFVASAWSFYVATFFGPKKHVVAAVIGFALNAAVIWLAIVVFQSAGRVGAEEREGQLEASATQQTADHYLK